MKIAARRSKSEDLQKIEPLLKPYQSFKKIKLKELDVDGTRCNYKKNRFQPKEVSESHPADYYRWPPPYKAPEPLA